MAANTLLARLAASSSKSVSSETPLLTRAIMARPCLVSSRTIAPRVPVLAGNRLPGLRCRGFGTASSFGTPASKAASSTRRKPSSSTAARTTSGAKKRGGRGTKSAAKKPKRKAAAKPKKKKKAAAAKKTKPKRRVRTAKQVEAVKKRKEHDVLKNLKEQALKPPKGLPTTAWTVYVAEKTSAAKGEGRKLETMIAGLAAEFKSMVPVELEQYNHTANQNKNLQEQQFTQWLRSHSPETIRQANLARKKLRRRAVKSGKRPTRIRLIKDNRQVKRPSTAYQIFSVQRHLSGDFKNIKIGEAAKLIAGEWKGLGDGEKKKFLDLQDADRARYVDEYKSTYGRDPAVKSRSSSPASSTS